MGNKGNIISEFQSSAAYYKECLLQRNIYKLWYHEYNEQWFKSWLKLLFLTQTSIPLHIRCKESVSVHTVNNEWIKLLSLKKKLIFTIKHELKPVSNAKMRSNSFSLHVQVDKTKKKVCVCIKTCLLADQSWMNNLIVTQCELLVSKLMKR